MLLCLLRPLAMLWLILHHLLRARPHPVTGATMTTTHTIVIKDDTTRAELEEAMANIVATLHRMPAHWTDRRASLHAKLDVMLEDWERADA